MTVVFLSLREQVSTLSLICQGHLPPRLTFEAPIHRILPINSNQTNLYTLLRQNNNTMRTSTIRQVSFLPETVIEIENREDYNEQETLDYWYSERELAKILIRSFKEAEKPTDDVCLRGLEQFTEGGDEHSENIQRCLNAVMDEQDKQWSEKQDDYDRLAVVSQEVSRPTITSALKRAEEDERDAEQIYRLGLSALEEVSNGVFALEKRLFVFEQKIRSSKKRVSDFLRTMSKRQSARI